MARKFNRSAQRKEDNIVVMENVASEKELQQAIDEVLEGYELRDREFTEYSWDDFEADMRAVDRTQQERRHTYRQMHATDHRGENIDPEMSHHALVDDDVRDFNQRQRNEQELRDLMHDVGDWF